MDLRPIGVWTFQLDRQPWPRARELVIELEELGYGAIWIPEAVGRDALVASALVLGATSRIVVATGIVPIYARDALTLNAAWRTLTEAYPDRFVLGIGVSHAAIVEGLRGLTYGPPIATMRTYLDRMDAAPFFAVPPTAAPRRVLAALGPRMLELARERTDGAHPYNVTPEHTARAREILGRDRILAVEQKVVLTTDASRARDVAREAMKIYLGLPNYVNNWRRLGFGDGDFADGGSDRFLDAMVASGDEDAIGARVRAHVDAGASHVCVQVLSTEGMGGGPPLDAWRRLAPVLTG